ncbi:hypothetical protein OH77DRAFT_1424594 [Trametes cingulata]|nr:hypothetical protein OH77DRAFT_1424594 [Trametes cingulata]
MSKERHSSAKDALDVHELPNLPAPLGEICSGNEMIPFWRAYDSWLRTHGITLYDIRGPPKNPSGKKWFAPSEISDSALPFAQRLPDGPAEPTGLVVKPECAYGQTAAGHDVFIKIIEKHSVEHAINRYLLENNTLFQADKFPFVLPPVAILDSPYGFSFLVMPLWNPSFHIDQDFLRVLDVLKFMECLLKGLVFLHSHKIAHRDISESNTLINCYAADRDTWTARDLVHEYIQHSSEVAYCLFDFDLSFQFPSDTDIRTARRPSEEAFRGAPMYHPSDVLCGQLDYNPFPFDVACLGNMFLYRFWRAIPAIPAMAPFLARMTTHVVEERFTAVEALTFFKQHLGHLPDEVLVSEVTLERSLIPLEHPDKYWCLLRPEQQEAWSQYRVPPMTWPNKLMLRLASLPYGWHVMRAVRRTLRL